MAGNIVSHVQSVMTPHKSYLLVILGLLLHLQVYCHWWANTVSTLLVKTAAKQKVQFSNTENN